MIDIIGNAFVVAFIMLMLVVPFGITGGFILIQIQKRRKKNGKK